ncbi:LuxR C-terminal-related transcriptional regulator [Kitasatospora hibisci]|uniref:helix-turn-helix transcriptional regulator n=1 Tax=Kitasatospora hibisci TaxID=3369522 RepID=UPI0037550BF7
MSALVGPPSAAQAQLEESVALLESASDPVELASSLTALGKLLSRSGDKEVGREHLRRALGIAQAASAARTMRKAHQGLLAAGARPRRLSQTGPASLTPRQRRVAAMAAEGLDSGAIASRLGITRRTVEFHLTHVYRKLQISGRNDLGAALSGGSGAPGLRMP